MNTKLLMPNLSWLPRLKHYGLSGDISAGVTGALLAFPQAIALAALAGMPPVYGIYASILPLVVASLWGSSWHAIGGTNTAMAMLLIAAVSSMADPMSDQYIAIILVLSIVTGIIQLLVGLFGFGRILDFISSTVISTLTMAVSLSIMIAVLPSALGSDKSLSGTVLRRLIEFPRVIESIDFSIFALSAFTLLSGFFAKRYLPKFSFIIAIIVGTSAFWLLRQMKPDVFSSAEMLQSVSFDLLSFAIPNVSLVPLDEQSVLHMLVSALSLALLGMTQAVVISRSLALSTGQRVDVNKEIVGQGMANITAGFFSAFAVSSSFSSSATNHASGANSPFSAIVIAILVVIIGLLASEYLTYIPVSVVSGGLLLIGIGMFKPQNFVTFRHPSHEFLIFLATLISSLAFGLIAGVVSGVVLSALVYLWLNANPTIHIEEQTASDGRPIHIVNIEGSLFYGAVQQVESVLRKWTQRDGQASTLIIRTDNLSYLDVPGVRLLVEEAERRLKEGGDFYLYIERDSVLKQLESSRLLPLIGEEHVIRPQLDHPMKKILFPYYVNEGSGKNGDELEHLKTTKLKQELSKLELPSLLAEDSAIKPLIINKLKMLRVFTHLCADEFTLLLDGSSLNTLPKGEVFSFESNQGDSFLVLIEGQLSLEYKDIEQSNSFNRKINAGTSQSLISPNFIQAESTLSALASSYYLILNAEKIEAVFARFTLTRDDRIGTVLDSLDAEIANEIRSKMHRKKVLKNQVLVHQGATANEFFIIHKGEANVIRHNLIDGNKHRIAKLCEGDSFGEEALLQGNSRNAEVLMVTDGEVDILSKQDFDKLLRPVMAPPITPYDALKLIESGVAKWLDCRFEPEYANGKLEDAIAMPLTKVRQQAYELKDDFTYIAYCNNGRRSQAVTFLLRERAKKVLYLEGGLNATMLRDQLQ